MLQSKTCAREPALIGCMGPQICDPAQPKHGARLQDVGDAESRVSRAAIKVTLLLFLFYLYFQAAFLLISTFFALDRCLLAFPQLRSEPTA